MKFRLGLFDEPTPDPARAVFPDAPPAGDREAAFEAAVQSIVLLKNKADILPLPDTISAIAVIGPNADDPQNQLGDWARLSGQGVRVHRPYAAGEVVTVLRGIRDRVPRAAVTYARGCDAVDGDTAVVGARYDDDNGSFSGSAYIFGPNDWTGALSTDWHNTGNWAAGIVPGNLPADL